MLKHKPTKAIAIGIFIVVIILLLIANHADLTHAGTTGPGDAVLVQLAAGDQCLATSGYTCTEIAAMQRLPETGGDLMADGYLSDEQVNGLAGVVAGVLCGLVMGLAVGIRWSRR